MNPMAAAEALGVEVVSERPGHAVCRLEVVAAHLNQAMVCHGGVLFTLADTALGLAANPPGEPTWAGTGFQLQLFRPVGVGDVVSAEAQEVNRSRQLLAYRATLRSGERLIGTLDAQLLQAVGGRPR
jgi:acyl-CoA thioesterase